MFHCGRDKNTENVPLELVKKARYSFTTSDKVARTKPITGLPLGDSQMK
jgi:hypothetical protein